MKLKDSVSNLRAGVIQTKHICIIQSPASKTGVPLEFLPAQTGNKMRKKSQ